MTDFTASVASILQQAQFRVDTAADNIANLSTPAYRRKIAYQDVEQIAKDRAELRNADRLDLKSGALTETGLPTDLALLSDGFFVVQTPQGLALTRSGAFARDPQGRFLTADGYALQLAGGGDLIASSNVRIFEDGAVMDGDKALGTIWTARPSSDAMTSYKGGVYAPPSTANLSQFQGRIRQGALEASNVSNTTEMIELVAAVRQAETGQKLMNVYDDMLGRTFSTLGS